MTAAPPVLSLSDCDSPTEVLCAGVGVPGITVTPRRAEDTRLSIPGDVNVIATDSESNWADTTWIREYQVSGTAAFVHERPGTYRVDVTTDAPYEPWFKEGVQVEMDRHGCNVDTVHLNSELERIDEAC